MVSFIASPCYSATGRRTEIFRPLRRSHFISYGANARHDEGMAAMTSRDQILAALRASAAPFNNVPPRPAKYLPVTQLSGSSEDLISRFKAELERLTGKVYQVSDVASALQQIRAIIGDDSAVLMWDQLPLPGIDNYLGAHQITRIIPLLPTG